MRLCIISVLAAMLGLVLGCTQSTSQPDEATQVDQTETAMPSESGSDEVQLQLSEVLKQVTDGSAVLVDVRSDEEWDEAHFAQAQHISIDRINEDAAAACAGLDKEKTFFLH